MVLLTSWEVVAARELSDRQTGTVKPSFYRRSASMRESPPAPSGHFRELASVYSSTSPHAPHIKPKPPCPPH
ncbi:hypothetical protein Q3G72_024495 [Acer saccharum]|nr:hypothetical protein Q3G72_024495 [Acer saccharum]